MLAGDLQGSAKDLRQTLASLRAIAAEVDQLLATNAAQIEQLAQQGVPGLNAALGDLQSLAASLNRIAARLETAPADYLLQRDRPKEYRGK
jgi:phospholipid/cholesterol/gamma-HCH transport system substrate-binding protein